MACTALHCTALHCSAILAATSALRPASRPTKVAARPGGGIYSYLHSFTIATLRYFLLVDSHIKTPLLLACWFLALILIHIFDTQDFRGVFGSTPVCSSRMVVVPAFKGCFITSSVLVAIKKQTLFEFVLLMALLAKVVRRRFMLRHPSWPP
jgi:hypothetical protein